MTTYTLEKVKLSLRISHSKLDDDISADIAACLADLQRCGVVYADDSDPLILSAIKLWCRALYTDDTAKAAHYQARYAEMRACLSVAEGYGRPEEGADE